MKILDIAKAFRNQKTLKYKNYKIITNGDILETMKIYLKNKLIAEYSFNPWSKCDLIVFSPTNWQEMNLVNSILEIFNLWEVKKKNWNLIYQTYDDNLKIGNIKEKYFTEKKVFLI